MVRGRFVTAFLVGSLLIAIACGGGGDGDGDGAEGGSSSSTSLLVEVSESTMGTPPPELRAFDGMSESDLPPVFYDEDAAPEDRLAALAEAALKHDLPELAAVLADGEITVAERRQAYQDALDCMVEQGMEVAQFEEYEGLYGTKFTFVIGWGSLGQDDASRVSTECEHRYVTFLEQFAYPIVSGERFTERTRTVLQECVAEFGVTDDVGYTMGELREVAPSDQAILECTTRAESKPKPPDVIGTGPSG